MPTQRIPSITTTRILIVVLALLAAGLAMWRVSTTAPAPEAPYFPPGHMQITANNRGLEGEKQEEAQSPPVASSTAGETQSVVAATASTSPPSSPSSAAISGPSESTSKQTGAKTLAQPEASIGPRETPVSSAPSAGGVQTALAAWRAAWEARDVETYMLFYHQDFRDRARFARQKNGVMVRAKDIRVVVQDIKIAVESQRTRAVFLQHYKSDSYESRDIKTQIWVASKDGPKILEEFTRARRGSEDE